MSMLWHNRRNDEVKTMKTLELRLHVTAEGKLVLPPVPEIKPGEYDAVLVIGQATALQSDRPPLNLPVIDVGEWPESLSLRREDIYSD
jgi:hypothetical protein